MVDKKRAMIVLFLVVILTCIQTPAQPRTANYSESYIITVQWCHYLEFIQEFTNHTFLVKIHTDSTPQDIDFIFTGRYLISNTSFLLNSSIERYRTIIVEVYELIDETQLLCDLTKEEGIGSAEIIFDSYTGHWFGDDQLGDESGYGRLNGCDDGSVDIFERDFELGFSIDVVDADGDGIPQWMEEQVYLTDSLINDAYRDDDCDGIPLQWEWNYGFNPFHYDDHRQIDSENDGISNYEEYLLSQWNSDPFRKDIFVELDQMEPGPNDMGFTVSQPTIMMVYQTYAERNIMFHIDDGCMGGGEIIPFDSMMQLGEEQWYYKQYFLHNDPENWRRGVFRYALYVNDHSPIKGLEFPGENTVIQFFKPGLNSFVISTQYFRLFSIKDHACLMLHELGHTLRIYIGHPLGCDNQLMRNPFSLQRILFRNYRSVMNYQYTYDIMDYSDGSHGFGDYDDWGNMDFTFFQPRGAE